LSEPEVDSFDMNTGKWGLLGIVLACATLLGSVALIAPAKRPAPKIIYPDGNRAVRVPFPVVAPLPPVR